MALYINMSRIGKKPIEIPKGVEVKIQGDAVLVKGPKGELKKEFRPNIFISLEDGNKIILKPKDGLIQTRKLWGTYRTLISNMIEGVTKGFEKKLEIRGIGYKAEKQGDDLVLRLGFSHPVAVRPKNGINFLIEKNIIAVSGIDKEKVGAEVGRIRALRKPDSYKGKGIAYFGEVIKLKPGKKVAAGAGAAGGAK